VIQPFWVRIAHWINAMAVILMVLSGWKVYDASPIFPFLTFPAPITLGGWLGGALLWHFAVMWVLVVNYVIYMALNIATGRLRKKLLSINPAALLRDFVNAFRGKLEHDDLSRYNTVQKVAYILVIADIALLILSGLAVFKSVQFPVLRELMGGYDNARIVHFFAMAFIVAFLVIHVVMVALVPRSLRLMILGK
jgi:thiosulfate reductase cytochrome b subunit